MYVLVRYLQSFHSSPAPNYRGYNYYALHASSAEMLWPSRWWYSASDTLTVLATHSVHEAPIAPLPIAHSLKLILGSPPEPNNTVAIKKILR